MAVSLSVTVVAPGSSSIPEYAWGTEPCFSASFYGTHNFSVGLMGWTMPLRYRPTWGKAFVWMTGLIKLVTLEGKLYGKFNLNSYFSHLFSNSTCIKIMEDFWFFSSRTIVGVHFLVYTCSWNFCPHLLPLPEFRQDQKLCHRPILLTRPVPRFLLCPG